MPFVVVCLRNQLKLIENERVFFYEISMSLKINTPTAMNMPQHYPQKEKFARTLTRGNFEQACVARGKKVRYRSLSPVGEKQVITPSCGYRLARGYSHFTPSAYVQN